MLLEQGLLPHEAPLGKRIGRIRVIVQDVFTPADPFPDWLNAVHRTTRERVIRRELLVREGEVLDLERIQESARNIRALALFSVVLIVPVYGETEEQVDLLVFAKDLFSLRLEWGQVRITGFGVDQLEGSLTERNIAGLGKEGRLRFGMTRGHWRVGELYLDRRLLGSRWLLQESADVLFPRADQGGGGPEGFDGSLVLARPLATTDTRWGGQLEATFSTGVNRLFFGDALRTWDDPTTSAEEALPWEYRKRTLSLAGIGLRSFGTRFKTDLGLGYGLRDRETAPLATGLAEPQAQRYAEWLRLPPDELAAYLIGRVHLYANVHRVLTDLESFGLSEDVRIGPELDFWVRQASSLLGSEVDWLELDGLLAYNLLHASGDLLLLSAGLRGRRHEGRWINNRLSLSLKNYSPLTKWGRIVYRLAADIGWEDQLGTIVTVGGDTSLRGYLAGSRAGLSAVRQNLELRTRPVELATFQLGGVLFWDSGDAFDRREDIWIRHSLGLGLRLLLPQTNRHVIRADLAIPLNGSETGFGGWFSFAFYQAF
ncbi:MAG: BamA/TamA family outer membrane protein [Myxococcota bacterium]|nr:BamA/TamA family outer membrane protein [Myxococcota bacterium]